jgi:hypothetical protein
MALPLIQKLLGSGHLTQEAHDRMKSMIDEHERKHRGLKGGYLGLAMMALPLIQQLLGSGHMDEIGSKKLTAFFKKAQKMEGAGVVGGSMMNEPVMRNMVTKPYPPKLMVERAVGMGKVKRVVGPEDGRRVRSAIVKRVMDEKNMSMCDASKYVKEHGLYNP